MEGEGGMSCHWVGPSRMHVTDWVAAEKEDPKLCAVLQWLESKKKTDLRTPLGSMFQVSRAGWYGEIAKISLPSKVPFTYTPPQKGRMRICYSLWCQRCTRLPPYMGASGIQDIKAVTILYPCYKNVSGGQEWPSR